MSVNQAQIDFWNGPTGQKWAKYQTEMDRNLADVAAAGLALANPQPGERVLDIGCGNGSTSLMLAEAVGPSGSVTGVDVSQPMLAIARTRAQERFQEKCAAVFRAAPEAPIEKLGASAPGNRDKSKKPEHFHDSTKSENALVPNIRFIEADAAAYPFQPDRDLIFSRFGVMFFAEPAAAFANIRKAAAPGARLAFACWRKVEENEWAMLPWRAAKPLLPEQPPADPHAPGPFAFHDPDRTRGFLAEAGFRDIAIEKFDGVMRLGTDPEHAGFQLTSLMGPTSRALKNVDDATRAKVRAAVTDAMTRFHEERGHLRPGIACWLVTARC